MTSQGKEQFKKYDCSSEMKYKYTAAKIDELGKDATNNYTTQMLRRIVS